MFSGIVEEVGRIFSLLRTDEGMRLTIEAPEIAKDIKIGDSVSVDGICLTVVSFDKKGFSVEAVEETLRRTKLGGKRKSDCVNLERALKLSDRLGGHLVTGHIDCVGQVIAIKEEGFSRLVSFGLDREWQPFFVEKGSVAVDGVSLTVVDCPAMKEDSLSKDEDFQFSVALIPHTLSVTTLGELKVGDRINIETDVVARYVARWLEPHLDEKLKKVTVSIKSK